MTDTGKGSASRLSKEQRAAFDERIRNASNAARSAPTIPRRADPDAPAPLSSAQQRLWLLDQLVPGSSWYNVTRTALVEGPLDGARLVGVLDRVVSRHEALRTAIVSRDGRPFQTVSSAASVSLSLVSLESLPEADREAAALAAALEDAEKPFDFAKPPLLRALLLRLSPRRHVFHLTAHHIVTDGWSMELLFREISALYEANSPASVPSLELQYADFCIWQRGWLESDRARSQMTHWADRLRGAAPLALPVDRQRPAVRTSKGVHRTRVLPRPVLDRLGELARSENATLFMVLLAAFDVFLQRHTGQDDISVATPIAGRTVPAIEPLIGFFANTLVLRSDLSGRPTFRELLRRVRETALDSYAHQDVPFEKLVEMLRPDRHLAQNPLAQVLFVLQNSPSSALALPGAKVTPIDLVTRTARFDLEFHARETEAGLSFMLIASSDLFDEDAPDRFLDRLEVLVSSIVANPDRPIDELALLPDSERRRIVEEWNPASAKFASGRCLHEVFESWARRSPESIAVEYEGTSLSYVELNRRSNRLARYLRRLGVGPGVLVAICLHRSLEMIVSIIAVSKAGGAYVPLDPSYPAERLRFMVEDAGARVLITDRSLSGTVPVDAAVSVCLVDGNAEAIAREADTDLDSIGSDEDLAYVIYTSGSTGRPKGVLITHRNVDRLFGATQAWFHFDEQDVWTLFHSYAFDFSVWEIWGALRYGGRLVVVPHLVTRSPEAFRELLSTAGVTVLNQTPSAFRQLIAADGSSRSPLQLRLVIFGGEALDPGMLEPWFDLHGDEAPRLVNMYGITETTVHVTYHPVSRADLERGSVSTIGHPIPDLQVYILDPRLELSPIGVAGELHVAGPGVARGYLSRPELTIERFIPNPFQSREENGRLYRSGDLGRYRASGGIEYLGRIDQQVKVRGHRVELGEVEAAVARHPAIRECVVVSREESPGDVRLVAYLLLREETVFPEVDLRSFLKQSLPTHMLPSAFVSLEALPLTPNGKVDRLALPAPGSGRPKLSESYAPPRDEVESALVAIWVGLLGVEAVGVHDDFFDLGGHSLLATQLISRIRDQFAVELPLRMLFQFPTVAELAERLSQAPAGAASGPIAKLDRQSRVARFEKATRITLDESTHRE